MSDKSRLLDKNLRRIVRLRFHLTTFALGSVLELTQVPERILMRHNVNFEGGNKPGFNPLLARFCVTGRGIFFGNGHLDMAAAVQVGGKLWSGNVVGLLLGLFDRCNDRHCRPAV